MADRVKKGHKSGELLSFPLNGSLQDTIHAFTVVVRIVSQLSHPGKPLTCLEIWPKFWASFFMKYEVCLESVTIFLIVHLPSLFCTPRKFPQPPLIYHHGQTMLCWTVAYLSYIHQPCPKQDQGSTALPFYIFLNVPDWTGAVKDTGLEIH